MNKYYIKDLLQKYGLKTRQSVYDRLKALSLEVKREGNKSYVTEAEISKLDELQEHISQGGSIKTFTPTVTTTVYSKLETTSVSDNSVESSIDSVNSQLDSSPKYVQLDLFQQLVDKVDEVVEKVIPANPINHWEKLDLAVERGYILSSSEVKSLVGTKPKGKEWIRGAFKFIRSGKIGNQAGWRVNRLK